LVAVEFLEMEGDKPVAVALPALCTTAKNGYCRLLMEKGNLLAVQAMTI
jgi:hypothetical protein